MGLENEEMRVGTFASYRKKELGPSDEERERLQEAVRFLKRFGLAYKSEHVDSNGRLFAICSDWQIETQFTMSEYSKKVKEAFNGLVVQRYDGNGTHRFLVPLLAEMALKRLNDVLPFVRSGDLIYVKKGDEGRPVYFATVYGGEMGIGNGSSIWVEVDEMVRTAQKVQEILEIEGGEREGIGYSGELFESEGEESLRRDLGLLKKFGIEIVKFRTSAFKNESWIVNKGIVTITLNHEDFHKKFSAEKVDPVLELMTYPNLLVLGDRSTGFGADEFQFPLHGFRETRKKLEEAGIFLESDSSVCFTMDQNEFGEMIGIWVSNRARLELTPENIKQWAQRVREWKEVGPDEEDGIVASNELFERVMSFKKWSEGFLSRPINSFSEAFKNF